MSVPLITDSPFPIPTESSPEVTQEGLTTAPEPAIEIAPSPYEILRSLPPALAYTRCSTVAEYLAVHAPVGSALERRMSEVRLTSDAQRAMVECTDSLNMLALVAEHLPDAPGVVPLWVRMAQCCQQAELRFAGETDLLLVERLLGDEISLHLDTVDLPHLLIFDDEWHLIAQWGPRPQAAESLLDEWLAQHPDFEAVVEAAAAETDDHTAHDALAVLTDELMLQMRLWYNSGLDAEGSAELQHLLAGLHEESESLEDAPDGGA